VWCGVVWCGVVWCGVVLPSLTLAFSLFGHLLPIFLLVFFFPSFLPLCVLAPLRLCVSVFPPLLFPFASLHLGHFSFKV
jgi:hypothetical protein